LAYADEPSRYIHALTQVLRLAFADGIQHIADPTHHTAHNPASLLSKPYLASRAKLFDPDCATPWPIHGHPELHIGDTVYLAVTDAAGNACSLINSVADNFGSLIVPKGTGFTLHCRGAGFQLAEGQPNVYAPRKRPYNTIIPALVTRPTDEPDKHDLVAVLGVMGGAMQPQGHVQVLLNMSLFGMDPQRALDASRICIGASVPGKSTDPSKKWDEALYLEDGISEDVARELKEMGHEVVIRKGMSRALFGRGQIIMVHEDDKGGRMYAAGSDPRGDGHAAPLV
jgi:gamma-glutamyltranspeptidase / glutathione hydrolase